MGGQTVVSNRRTRVTALLAAALVGLGGAAACGTPTHTDEVLPARFVEQGNVSQSARQAYGERADEAYREIAEWSLAQWLYDPLLEPGVNPDKRHFETGIVDRLAPGMRTFWLSEVDKALAGDQGAQGNTQVLRYHSWTDSRLQIPGDSAIDSQAVSGAAVSMAPADEVMTGVAEGTRALRVSFTHTARLHMLAGRDPYPATLRREAVFTVVPADTVDPSVSPSPSTTPTPVETAEGATPSVGTRSAAAPEVNPDVEWAITAYHGSVEVVFDKDANTTTATAAEETE